MELSKEVFTYFGLDIDTMTYQIGRRYKAVDWIVGDAKKVGELISIMTNSITKKNQRIVAHFDKNYPYALVLREELGKS